MKTRADPGVVTRYSARRERDRVTDRGRGRGNTGGRDNTKEWRSVGVKERALSRMMQLEKLRSRDSVEEPVPRSSMVPHC